MKKRRQLKRKENELYIPILRGVLSLNKRRIKVFCPICDDWHYHGYPCEPGGIDHRAAHCTCDSPLRKTGYWIAPFPAKDLKPFNDLSPFCFRLCVPSERQAGEPEA